MVGHHLGQLFLRVGLAATFLTMGLSKVLKDVAYEGEAAAALANMGVIKPPSTPAGGGAAPISYQPEGPGEPAGESEEPEQGEEPGSETPGAEPEAPEAAGAGGGAYTAADFPEPVILPAVYNIALLLKSAAHPTPNEDGTDRMALVPSWAADGKVPGLGMATPVVLAWLAAITEIVGGGMLLVGFMSRLWALGLVGVMFTAIWLTAIGPAMQGGTAFLGFLPNKGHIFTFTEHGYLYMHEFWQLALACMALGVLFGGPGALSVDGILFGGGGDGDEGGED